MIVRKIKLVWRAGHGERRIAVGEFTRNATYGLSFAYDLPQVRIAEEQGFRTYPEFSNIERTYTTGVLDVISQRLIQVQNPINNRHLSFWEAQFPTFDIFDRVALTQGLLATDNFEFLGVYNPKPGFSFITDLSGVGFQNLPSDLIKEGERVYFEFERNNEFDNKAVLVKTRSGVKLGYVKIIHNSFLHRAKNVRLEVKSVNQNGLIKKVYIRVSVPIHW